MEEESIKNNPNDHLANERTFLAWIRTSIAIMGFGFVVVKFSLFIRQIALAIGTKTTIHQTGDSKRIGIMLVGLGAITILLSFIRYQRTKKQLELGAYYHSTLLIKVMTSLIFLSSIILIVYLLNSVS